MIDEKLFKEKNYKDGEVIFRQGEPGTEMYIIKEGGVRVVRDLEKGRQVIANLIYGDFFGEMAIFDDLPRSASAQSEGDSILRVLDRQTIKNGIKTNPEMAFYLLEIMSRRLRQVDEQLEELMNERDNGVLSARGPI